MRGDVDAVRELLRGGADVNASQGDGMTALHWAAEHGDVDMTGVLIYAGANLESVTRIGAFTPLHVAARSASGEVVRALLEAGADPEARTTTGETALHFAASAGSPEAVAALADAGADLEVREHSAGQTPLMFAAAAGSTDAMRALLEAGADLEARTRVIDYPAMAKEDREASQKRDERLQYLHGETRAPSYLVDGTNSEDDEEEEGEEGEEAEDAEEKAGETEGRAARERLSYDQLVGEQGGHTALLYAAREGNRDAVQVLLEAGADVNQVSEGDHTSPLLMATLNAHFDLAMELLEAGADPNLTSKPGATPLYAAIHMQWVPKSFYPQPRVHRVEQTTYLELMEALLEAGADPNPRLERHLWYTSYNHNVLGVDTWGATPFWRAAYGTDVEAMKLLVSYGADPTIPTFRPPGRPSTGNGADDSPEVEDPSGVSPEAV